MKKLALILVLALAYSFLGAQPPAPGSYITNNYIDKFEGTWQWVSGQDTLTIKLKKYRHTVSDYDEDILLGSHAYVKNGVLVESSLNTFDDIPLNHKKNTVYLWNMPAADTAKVEGGLKDISKHKRTNLYLQYVDGSTPTLTWHLETAEATSIDPNFQYGLTMPKDIILTKQ